MNDDSDEILSKIGTLAQVTYLKYLLAELPEDKRDVYVQNPMHFADTIPDETRAKLKEKAVQEVVQLHLAKYAKQ